LVNGDIAEKACEAISDHKYAQAFIWRLRSFTVPNGQGIVILRAKRRLEKVAGTSEKEGARIAGPELLKENAEPQQLVAFQLHHTFTMILGMGQ
jgi:hypothetical protein